MSSTVFLLIRQQRSKSTLTTTTSTTTTTTTTTTPWRFQDHAVLECQHLSQGVVIRSLHLEDLDRCEAMNSPVRWWDREWPAWNIHRKTLQGKTCCWMWMELIGWFLFEWFVWKFVYSLQWFRIAHGVKFLVETSWKLFSVRDKGRMLEPNVCTFRFGYFPFFLLHQPQKLETNSLNWQKKIWLWHFSVRGCRWHVITDILSIRWLTCYLIFQLPSLFNKPLQIG